MAFWNHIEGEIEKVIYKDGILTLDMTIKPDVPISHIEFTVATSEDGINWEIIPDQDDEIELTLDEVGVEKVEEELKNEAYERAMKVIP